MLKGLWCPPDASESAAYFAGGFNAAGLGTIGFSAGADLAEDSPGATFATRDGGAATGPTFLSIERDPAAESAAVDVLVFAVPFAAVDWVLSSALDGALATSAAGALGNG